MLVRDLLRERRPRPEDVPVAGHPRAAVPVAVRSVAKTINLRLEAEVGVVERLRNTPEGMKVNVFAGRLSNQHDLTVTGF